MAKKVINVEEWTNEVLKTLVLELGNVLNDQEDMMGKKYNNHLVINFIAQYIGFVVYTALKKYDGVDATADEKFKLVSSHFSYIKGKIQEAVAAGFQGALSTYSGKTVEYYCLVKPTPKAANKEPC